MNADTKETEYANLVLLQGQVSSLGGAMGNLEKKMDNLPGVLMTDFKLALHEALDAHKSTCPVLAAYPELMRDLGRLDEVSKVVETGELTSRQRRENARASGAVSISPEGVRIPWKAIPIKWIITGIVALLSALGIARGVQLAAVVQNGAVEADTDAPAVVNR
jgi:hypothetical protein